MPLVFREEGFRHFFYFNEGDPREPARVHVLKGGVDAKFWLSPSVAVATIMASTQGLWLTC